MTILSISDVYVNLVFDTLKFLTDKVGRSGKQSTGPESGRALSCAKEMDMAWNNGMKCPIYGDIYGHIH